MTIKKDNNHKKGVYVFLSHPIAGIGGAQTYVRDKSRFLQNEGFEVIVISGGRSGRIIIKDFEKYEDISFPELLKKPIIFTKKKREIILNKIIEVIHNQGCPTFIESSDINSAEWGEIIAERIDAKHILFCLSEQFGKYSRAEYEFLKHKLEKKELFGITKNTIPLLFGRDIENAQQYVWNASCRREAEDVENEEIRKISKADYTIGSIGRYDKPYVPYMLSSIRKFALKHKENSINVVLCIGANGSEIQKSIRDKFSDLQNVKLYIFGQLVPLPKILFQKCDAFVSVAGCAAFSRNEGVPTITLDANDHRAIGILGLTTTSTIYRKDEPPVELDKMLESVLIDKCCEGKTIEPYHIDHEAEYRSQLCHVLGGCGIPNRYFNVSGMKLNYYNFMQKILNLMPSKLYSFVKSSVIRVRI